MNELDKFQEVISYHFKQIELLKEALTHRSYTFENKNSPHNNQRMEFLGDAILELISSEFLYQKYPDCEEGELTKIRAAMIRRETLFELAQSINLDNYLYLGKGERQIQGKNQETRMSDAFESIVASIYLDSGLENARLFYLNLLLKFYPEPHLLLTMQNPKGNLQELSQKMFHEIPHYQIRNISGPDHQPTYEVEIKLTHKIIGVGKASSRKGAEEEAARQGIDYINNFRKQSKKSD